MIELTPRQAASLSSEVYALTKFPVLEDAITHLNHEYGGNIAFYEENMLKGKTGGPGFIKVRTAFGFLLMGKKNLTGHAFVLFRGTQYLADWLTNLNLTLSPSASGQPVHDGFNKAFHSMLPQISAFVRALPAGTRIHCLGHSLGGSPSTNRDFFLPSPGLVPWKTYHDMALYQESVESKSWEAIQAMRPAARTDSGIEAWLRSKAIIGQTMSAIEWLNDAIIYVVKKCMEFAGRVLNITATTYFTLMDQLAMVLNSGAKLLVGSVSLVTLLVKKIMQFLGMKSISESISVTHDFLRNLLMKLSSRVNEISKQALSATLAEGRGV